MFFVNSAESRVDNLTSISSAQCSCFGPKGCNIAQHCQISKPGVIHGGVGVNGVGGVGDPF